MNQAYYSSRAVKTCIPARLPKLINACLGILGFIQLFVR